MDPVSDSVKSHVKKTDLLIIIHKDDKIVFYGDCKTVITEDSLLFRSANDLKYTDANLAKSFVCHEKIVCIKENEIDTNKYAIILSDENNYKNIDCLINEVNGHAQTDATKLDNDYFFQAKFLKPIAEECERDDVLADKIKDILLEVLVFYQNNKSKETVDGSVEKIGQLQSDETDSDNDNEESDSEINYDDSSDDETDTNKLITNQHPTGSGDTKEDDKNFPCNNEDKESDTEITFEYIDSSDEEEINPDNFTTNTVLSDTFLDEDDDERNRNPASKMKTNEKETVFDGAVEKVIPSFPSLVVPTNDGNEGMDSTNAYEYTGSSEEEEEESILDNATANHRPSNNFSNDKNECDTIPRKRSIRQAAIKTNGFYAENVENLSPPSKKRKRVSFFTTTDNKNFVSQNISKFSSKSRNDSTIIKAPNYKLVTGNYGGRDVQHLYVFDSEDKTLCYKYTWKNMDQKFRCNSCNWENMSHVWAKLIEENGEKCVELGPKPHSCKLQKFGEKRRTIKLKKKVHRNYIFLFSGYQIIKRKYGERFVKHLVIFNENDKFLCYELTWKPEYQLYVCNMCMHKYHSYVSAKIFKNEEGEEYVRTGPRPHKCSLQKFVPND